MFPRSKKSYLCTNVDRPFVYTSFPDLLDERAYESPDKPAHIFRDLRAIDPGSRGEGETVLERKVVSFKDIADKSRFVAANLLDLGINPGDRIGVLGRNSPEWLFLDYACLRINVLMIRIPGSLMYHDAFVEVLYRYRCNILFVDHGETIQDINRIMPGLLNGKLPEEDSQKLGSLRIMYLRSQSDTDQLKTVRSMSESKCDVTRVMAIQECLDPDDIAIVLPTSGTTGIPKFCAFSHFKIINASIASMTGFDPETKGYAVVGLDLPMTWIGGLHFSPVSTGFTFVHIDQSIGSMSTAAELIFQIVREEQVTSIAIMPFMLYDALKAQQAGKLTISASLENIVTGGERIPQELISLASTVFKSVLVYYGLTEGYECLKNKPLEKGFYTTEMMPHYEAKITDDNGGIVSRGVPGNLQIRSPLTMIGFLDDPDASAKVKSSSGWLDTGDVAIIHESGFLEVVGRTKHIISCSTRKIYPKTIEGIILKNPKVENVIVIGLPDVRFFEVVCACVIPKPDTNLTEQELHGYCANETLESILVPKYFMFLDNFPKGSTGKISRHTLLEMAKKHFDR